MLCQQQTSEAKLAVPWRPQGLPIGPIDGQLIGIAIPTNKHAGALFISYRQSLAFEYAQNSLNLKVHIFSLLPPLSQDPPAPLCSAIPSMTQSPQNRVMEIDVLILCRFGILGQNLKKTFKRGEFLDSVCTLEVYL